MVYLSPFVVLVIGIVSGSGAIVLGYSMHRLFIGFPEIVPFPPTPDSQREYMRDVRLRNQANMMHASGECIPTVVKNTVPLAGTRRY